MYTLIDMADKVNKVCSKIAAKLGESNGVDGSTNKVRRQAQETIKINDALIKEILPYDLYDSQSQLFINDKSIGFGYNLHPLSGADDNLVQSIAELIKNKLPAGWDCLGGLYKHSMIGGQIVKNFEPLIKKGGLYKTIGEMGLKYHLKASQKGYKNKRNYPCKLSDYRCYLFISHPLIDTDSFEEELLTRASIEAELDVCQFSYARIDDKELCTFLQAIVSPDLQAPIWPDVSIDKDKPLSHSIPKRGTKIIVDDASMQAEVRDEQGELKTTTIVNMIVKKWPEYFALWQSSDNFVNVLQPENGIQCPFLLTFNIRALSHEQQKSKAAGKSKSLSARDNEVYRRLCPSIAEEAADQEYVHKQMLKDTLTVCDVSFNLILFSTPDDVRKDMAAAIGSFRQNDIDLIPAYGTQWLTFLSSLPFVMSEGMHQALKMFDQVQPLTSWNAANFLPFVAEFKGGQQGLIMPTLRNQIAALDFHDDLSLPITNFNKSVLAGSGAGKSQLANNLVTSELALGHQVFIIDIGGSFKHIAEIYDAVYIDEKNLQLNPFTLFDFEGKAVSKDEEGKLVDIDSAEQIRDLLCLMVNPSKTLDAIEKDWLLTAVHKVSKTKKCDACIDDVIDVLNEMLSGDKYAGDRRLKDITELLEKYSTRGSYSHMFNNKTQLFNNNQLVVLELGGLSKNPELLQIVLFSLILVIQGQFYHTPRHIKKSCIIDEVWQHLGGNDNETAAKFIDTGCRTGRKYNAGYTLIGQKLDEFKYTKTGRAIEACCDVNIIMRQANLNDYLKEHPKDFTPFQEQMIRKFGEAKSNGFSEMMIKFGGSVSFHRLFNDPFSKILYSTAGDEYQDVEDLISQGLPIEQAVLQIAQKYYGDEL